MIQFNVQPIGIVESSLRERHTAPRQADEGAPEAALVFDPAFLDGLKDLRVGDEIILLTWLHLADRGVLVVHPRGDESRLPEGIFSTRTEDRPNPVGLHRTTITAIDGCRIRVRNLEALNGTPIIDLKPVLSKTISHR